MDTSLRDRVTVLSHNDEIFMTNRLHNMKVMYNPLSFPRLFEPTQKKKKIFWLVVEFQFGMSKVLTS